MSTNHYSLSNYFRHYKSVFGLITTLLCSIPILSSLFSDKIERYLFPPLGNFDAFGRIFTIALVLLATMSLYFAKDLPIINDKQRRFFLLLKMLFITIGFYLIFFILNVLFVQTVTLNDDSKTVLNLSIGYEKQQWAKDTLKNATNYDILTKIRGPYEKEIQNVWTMSSLVIIRVGLLLSYLGSFLFAISTSSLLILFDFHDAGTKRLLKDKTKKEVKTVYD